MREISENKSYLRIFLPGVGAGWATLDKHDGGRSPGGRVVQLDVVGPLHTAPVVGLDLDLQSRQAHGLTNTNF